MKRKPLILLILLSLVLSCSSCIYWNKKPEVNVMIRSERKDIQKSSLLILNMVEPSYAAGSGAHTAEIFHNSLLKSKKFRVVGLCVDSPWVRVSDLEETRLMDAVEEARKRNFDYVLAGELTDYYYGGIQTSRVSLKIRVIEVATRITIFFAQYSRQNEARDSSFPMNTKLSGIAQPPEKLVIEMVDAFIAKM